MSQFDEADLAKAYGEYAALVDARIIALDAALEDAFEDGESDVSILERWRDLKYARAFRDNYRARTGSA